VAAAALMHRYRAQAAGSHPARLRYWKPIQTGIVQDDDTERVRGLSGCRAEELLAEGVRLARPVSPHLAARLSGRPIALPGLVSLAASQPPSDRWVVEGAGGVMVPVTDTGLMVDLMARLGLPVLVVARSALGTINHTLLTLEALRARSLAIAGVLIVGPRDPDNRDAIESFGQVNILGELPVLDPLTPEALGRWADAELDPEGRLWKLFR
jgi:dethiobiotin synthase